MSNKFINDHSVRDVEIYEIIKITSGGFHSWCKSNVGIIRKPNINISQSLWNKFKRIEPEKIVEQPKIVLKWYHKIWNWFINLFKFKKWLKK